ncbi:XRE family transcriptional regulator [Clostridium sp. OM02-18AC]|uniref:helix-turn-helix domain-containing protein n=1 Tax=Clostridium sp. OM02-18AC TaxID=2292311 RepID=UPI000E4992DB|nr:helix-turn-helix transcriptional regulator [Clostridium sp. OM02-18AC]RHV63348.1 XRE family transcriptional regulator [Clostridium sp. OM02-18AC]
MIHACDKEYHSHTVAEAGSGQSQLHAYDEDYLPLAQRVLGDMLDYAVNTLDYDLQDFYTMFLISGMAAQFEIGNCAFVAGKNGCEIAKEVLRLSGLSVPDVEDLMYLDKSPEYWTGWVLAYYQWYRVENFKQIQNAVPVTEVCGMYDPLHEADISKFVEIMDERMQKARQESRLKRLRAYAKLSQRELAAQSGVPLRQIQLFEQGERDIGKTQARTLQKLARVLHVSAETLTDS